MASPQPSSASTSALDAPDASLSLSLTDLAAGQVGRVVRIVEDDHAMLIRLKTMGVHEGRSVRLVRPGSRLIVSCGGTRIGLAAEVAQHIRVAPDPA